MPKAKTIIVVFALLSTSFCFSIYMNEPVSNIHLLNNNPDPNQGQESLRTQLAPNRFSNQYHEPFSDTSRILQTTKLRILSSRNSSKSKSSEKKKRRKKHNKDRNKKYQKSKKYRDRDADFQIQDSGHRRYSDQRYSRRSVQQGIYENFNTWRINPGRGRIIKSELSKIWWPPSWISPSDYRRLKPPKSDNYNYLFSQSWG